MPEQNQEQMDSIKNRFTYHPPHGDQASRYVALREKGMELANLICFLSVPSREQALAITKLEESIMWANAGIARNEPMPPQDFKDRVLSEKSALDENLKKLSVFLGTPEAWDKASSAQREMLVRQETIMRAYSDVLAERIADLKK